MTSTQNLKKIKLGNIIEQMVVKNDSFGYGADRVMGMTIAKELIPTKADVRNTDLSDFLVVKKHWFVMNPRTHGKRIGLAFNDNNDDILISWNNITFRVKDETVVDPKYLFIYFNRNEWDREATFRSWGSSTEVFSFETLCNMEMFLPNIDIQRKFVSIYDSLLFNMKSFETGLDDMKLVCDGFFDKLKKTNTISTLGDYITRIDIKNTDNKCKKVMGVSTSKEFREPTSKVDKNELSKYKICKPRQISFVQTTHNEKVFCNAMNRFDEDVVVTSVNEVFECDETRLLPEFLTMYFNRKEFDRYARYHSWGSAREVFTWDDLIRVKMPIPSLDVQKSIVLISNSLIDRKEYLKNLKNILSNVCSILMRGSIVEAEGGSYHAN